MLYVEEDNTIRLTRGDTARFSVIIKNNVTHETYTILPEDVLVMSIKKSIRDANPVIQKTVTGTNIFHILPTDTHSLNFGKYVYDVQITTGTDVYTVIEPTCFEVMKEVTF